MSAPKSVIKINKDGVQYTSNLDATQYYLFELNRAALRDVGKFVRKKWQELYDSHFKKHTGKGRKATSVRVVSSANTIYPRCEIGLKTGKVDGFYAYFQEFGTSRQPRLGLLTHAAEDNVAEIVKIESQYLSGLSDESERLQSLIDENEYNEEEE